MQQIVVTAAVIVTDGQVLLAQRLPKGREGGKWEFPGGKVDPGEDPRAGLVRELREELGIVAEVGEILEVISEAHDDIHLILLYFRCTIRRGNPTPLECQQVAWLDPVQVEPLEKPPADERFWQGFRDTFSP